MCTNFDRDFLNINFNFKLLLQLSVIWGSKKLLIHQIFIFGLRSKILNFLNLYYIWWNLATNNFQNSKFLLLRLKSTIWLSIKSFFWSLEVEHIYQVLRLGLKSSRMNLNLNLSFGMNRDLKVYLIYTHFQSKITLAGSLHAIYWKTEILIYVLKQSLILYSFTIFYIMY